MMCEYKPTEYVVDFGDTRSNQFVRLNMALIEQNSAKLRERIVRCCDCRYYQHNNFPRCDLYSIAHEVEPDGYCAWAERRDPEWLMCKCGEEMETEGVCPSCGRMVRE